MKKVIVACTLVSLLFAVPAFAATPAGGDAVKELGKINGVALACRQQTTMNRITQELEKTLPKTADITYDQIFKDAMQQSLIQHQKTNAACPNETAVKPQIDALFKQLRQARGN
ncbi:MAG: hypothetical protein LBQ81_05280 [Zoogloeaceae bacterium]|jgi:hypothetical protein|nr:hypothetical protein [Zoogloeaceae bacterium]